jgi:phosphohistidine phosphatase
MNLYILRHGIAVEAGTGGYTRDADRPLTPKGRRKLRLIARAMKALELDYDLVVSSPYVRARQTAERIARDLGAGKKVLFSKELTPGGSSGRLIEFLNGLETPRENVLLVGHEPYLSGLVALLVWGSARGDIVLRKGGLCKLTVEELKPRRCAALEWLLTPKQMALMA